MDKYLIFKNFQNRNFVLEMEEVINFLSTNYKGDEVQELAQKWLEMGEELFLVQNVFMTDRIREQFRTIHKIANEGAPKSHLYYIDVLKLELI